MRTFIYYLSPYNNNLIFTSIEGYFNPELGHKIIKGEIALTVSVPFFEEDTIVDGTLIHKILCTATVIK
jgi:hypothetical protein